MHVLSRKNLQSRKNSFRKPLSTATSSAYNALAFGWSRRRCLNASYSAMPTEVARFKDRIRGFGIGIFSSAPNSLSAILPAIRASLFQRPGSRSAGTADQCRRVRPLSRNKETGDRGVIDRELRFRGGNGSRPRPSNRVPRGARLSRRCGSRVFLRDAKA